jgi:hypothetical protein
MSSISTAALVSLVTTPSMWTNGNHASIISTAA